MKDFKCQGCGACCQIKDGIVRVGDDEIKRIAALIDVVIRRQPKFLGPLEKVPE